MGEVELGLKLNNPNTIDLNAGNPQSDEPSLGQKSPPPPTSHTYLASHRRARRGHVAALQIDPPSASESCCGRSIPSPNRAVERLKKSRERERVKRRGKRGPTCKKEGQICQTDGKL